MTGMAALGTLGLAGVTAGVWVYDGDMLFHYLFDDSSGGPDPSGDFGSGGQWVYKSDLSGEGFACAADTYDGPNCPTEMPSGPGLVWVWHDGEGQSRQDVMDAPAGDTCAWGVPAPWYGTHWTDPGWTHYCDIWNGSSWHMQTFGVQTYFATVSEGGVPLAVYPNDGSVTPPSGADVITASPPYRMPPYYPEPDRPTTAQQISSYLQQHPDLASTIQSTIAPVVVPSIQDGETPDSYAARLAQLGLQGEVVTLSHTDLDEPDGDVVMANPAEGSNVAPGSQVEIDVNPTKPDTSPNEECRPSDTPAAGDPGDNPPGYSGNNPQFQDYMGSPYPGIDPRQTPPAAQNVDLFWGGIFPAGTTHGWGYRHIAATRGYGPTDEAQTKLALAGPNYYEDDPSGNTWVFDYPYTAQDQSGSQIACLRRVVVQYAKRDYEPSARYIITSFYGSPAAQ